MGWQRPGPRAVRSGMSHLARCPTLTCAGAALGSAGVVAREASGGVPTGDTLVSLEDFLLNTEPIVARAGLSLEILREMCAVVRTRAPRVISAKLADV